MPKILFNTTKGLMEISSDEDCSVMELAKRNDVPGIDADCGGQMACGTCHVILEEKDLALLDPPAEMEQTILDYVPEPRPDARLSCQIRLRKLPDNIVFTIPDAQR